MAAHRVLEVMPLAPRMSRAIRAISSAMATLLRLASETRSNARLAALLQPAELQGEELGLGDLGHHVRQLGLHELERRRSACRTGRAPWRSRAPRRSRPWPRRPRPRRCRSAPGSGTCSGLLRPVRLGQQVRLGDQAVLEHQLGGDRGAQGVLPLHDRSPCSPGVPFSTRNPRIPSSVLAQTTATSAMVPLVIHILAPLSSQPSFTRSPW